MILKSNPQIPLDFSLFLVIITVSSYAPPLINGGAFVLPLWIHMAEKFQQEYDLWNEQKKRLDETERKLFFKEGEIWWCSVGRNIGEEVYGKGDAFRRPVAILKKLSGNTCVVLPTTSKPRDGSWFHSIHVSGKDRWVMMNQIRFISGNRLWVRESSLSTSQFSELKKSVAFLLGLGHSAITEISGKSQM